MDGSVILLPIATAPNGFTKSHNYHEYISQDHWYNKENIIRDDVWGRSDLKIHHQSPPPLGPPPALIPPPLQHPPLTPTLVSVPPPISAPIMSPPPNYVTCMPPQHQREVLNLKNSMKHEQTTIHGVSTTPRSNAMVSVAREDKEPMAAPDLESMDEIWHGEFSKVFAPYLPHIWYLSPTEICPSPRWRRFKDSAKVRFCCQTCGHGWTSMKGRVVFWYFLHLPFCEGFVQFKLYGQQCMRCNNGMFEPAMWYPEEVNKVLCNLYNRIGQTYYGFVKPPIRYDRRAGKPRTQHNATLCQACRDGECDSRPRTGPGPATPGPPPHAVLTPTPTKIPPPTVSTRTVVMNK